MINYEKFIDYEQLIDYEKFIDYEKKMVLPSSYINLYKFWANIVAQNAPFYKIYKGVCLQPPTKITSLLLVTHTLQLHI